MDYAKDYANAAASQINPALNAWLGASAAANLHAAPKQRPLESIAAATQRVNNAIVGVQDFLDRWHGQRPESTNAVGPEPGPCYSGELERLMSAVERLESRIVALNEIG